MHEISEILVKQYAKSYFKTRDSPVFKNFEIWDPILICFYLDSLISNRNVFVLQIKLWVSLFKWIMSQPSSMFVDREIKQKLRFIFLWTPCKSLYPQRKECSWSDKVGSFDGPYKTALQRQESQSLTENIEIYHIFFGWKVIGARFWASI